MTRRVALMGNPNVGKSTGMMKMATHLTVSMA